MERYSLIPTPMASEHDHDALSPELIAALRSLGGVRAPAELAEAVELARMPRVAAPPELWTRVASALEPDFAAAPRRGRVLSWPRWAAAAAVLVLGGLAWWQGFDLLGRNPGAIYAESGLAPEVPEERRRELIARLAVREVAPPQLSPLIRSFMPGLPEPMRREG